MYDYEEVEVEELPVSCVEARIDSMKYHNFKYRLKQYEHLKEEQIRDLYSIYYKEEYEFNLNEDNSNFWWFKLLNKFNKQNIKVATKRNSFMCEELLPIFCDSLNYILKEKEEELKEQEKQKQEEESEQENENNSGQGTSQPDSGEENQQNNKQSSSNQKINEKEESNSPNQKQSNSSQQNTPSNGAGKQQGKNSKNSPPQSKEDELEKFIDKEVKKALKKIADKTEDIAESYPEAFEETDDDDGEKVNKQVVQKLLSKVKFDKSAINQFVKSTIKRVQNHFGSIVKLKEESLFDTDDFDDLDGLEFLLLPEIFWEEVVNRTKEKSVVVDVMIDESGSMQSKRNISETYNSFTRQGTSRQVEMFTLAKILCHYLNADKYMNDLYMFDTSVRQITDFEEMYTRSANGGGTSIDNCIRKIHLTNNPTIIITDANDNITEYSELAYILNIDYQEAQSMYEKATWNKTVQRYIDNNQILSFLDGKWFTKVQLDNYIKESQNT